MGKSFFITTFFLCMGILQAQDDQYVVTKGDILILSAPSGSRYQHIDFPRKNIIIKRGAIADFNGLIGKKLIVHDVAMNENGTTKAVLKRKDGMNFFRFCTSVRANIDNAIASGELKVFNFKKKDAIVQQ